MSLPSKTFLGKLAYSLIFTVLLPVGLWLWAKGATHAISLPVVQSNIGGISLMVVGLLFMLMGMHALWHFGKGLPMNAYPPPKFVQESVFALVPHPIYAGFIGLVLGISIYTGNAAGFWLISPVVLLGCMALVWGFERLDLLERFPDASRRYFLAIPPNESFAPKLQHRLSVYLCLLLPWVFFNASIFWMYGERTFSASFFQFPETFISPTSSPIMSILPLVWVFGAPLFAKTQQQLRSFFMSGLLGGLAVVYLAWMIPVIGPGHASKLFHTAWMEAFFSFSWYWIWVAARLYKSVVPGFRAGFTSLGLLLTYGLLANSLDPLSHLISGLVGIGFAFYYPAIWAFLRKSAEVVANSWKEWVFGPIRIINHGFYVGAAAFLGTLTGAFLAGEAYVVDIVIFGVIITVCAGLWGQFVEGSDKLKRPFGFYGSLLGAVLACMVMHWMHVDAWVMAGIFSVFMPGVQAVGRLRCLINGCCHGAPSSELVGIHYVHPRSRVCYISGLKGKPLYPTQLYSLLWLVLLSGFQFRLWQAGTELSFILGAYLIFNGLGRFVEEAYRGEPQTPILGKLRLYQWAALASVIGGIAVTFLEAPMPDLTPFVTWKSFAWAAFTGFFVQFMMGIDFPRSNMRFSRLA